MESTLKPGDIVTVRMKVWGLRCMYNTGEMGIVLGPAEDDENRSKGCLSILIRGGQEDFSPRMLEVVNEQ